MPKFDIEIDDKGEFVGQLPGELNAILEKVKATAHGEGFGKGNQKAAEEAKKQIEDAIKSERLKLEAQMPLEKARWDEIDQQNKLLKQNYETAIAESRKSMTAREEAHALETTKRMEATAKRDAKIRGLVNQTLRGLASAAGARDESLSELEVILQHRIGFDDDMEPYVKGEDGQPAKTAAGNPLGMETFVKQYLENHPHHRKPVAGQGGGARGGASFRGTADAIGLDAAKERVAHGDRSATAINDVFEAARKKRSA
jgi:hypothetical protein